MLNSVNIMGRLLRDPELRKTGDGTSICSFSIAVDRDFAGKESGERETDFIDCVAWRRDAEFVANYFKKGAPIIVCGRLQTRSWLDRDGNKRRGVEVVADSLYFGDSKKSNHEEEEAE